MTEVLSRYQIVVPSRSPTIGPGDGQLVGDCAGRQLVVFAQDPEDLGATGVRECLERAAGDHVRLPDLPETDHDSREGRVGHIRPGTCAGHVVDHDERHCHWPVTNRHSEHLCPSTERRYAPPMPDVMPLAQIGPWVSFPQGPCTRVTQPLGAASSDCR
ncbi:hypothetical protein Hesp01_23130 [Herbidospora sp. NBRC 101105]|nr:hypothetical protein Hesp01_23130 [Herbidospora sp. NBRC 101105]